MKVSVIVPVFNAGEYLKRCLDSILCQTYSDFEAILVDDGSSDGSGAVCDQYGARDMRFKVIHKRNEGLICARIDGIRAAQGSVIAFVDADDWVDTDFLTAGMRQMEREAADVIISGCVLEEMGQARVLRNRIAPGVYGRRELEQAVFPRMLHFEGFYVFGLLPFMWNKLYRKELLESCYADIDTRIYDGEDAAVVYPYLLKAQKAVITEDAKYHYRIHGESMTSSRREDYYENAARLYLHLKERFQETDSCECMMPQLDQYMRMMVWQGNPAAFVESNNCIFPFGEVPKGSRIILYGAGYVGQVFRHQITLSGYCEIAAWVDKAYREEALCRIGVSGPETLRCAAYDFVVIAVNSQKLADEIGKELEAFGVRSSQIISGVRQTTRVQAGTW